METATNPRPTPGHPVWTKKRCPFLSALPTPYMEWRERWVQGKHRRRGDEIPLFALAASCFDYTTMQPHDLIDSADMDQWNADRGNYIRAVANGYKVPEWVRSEQKNLFEDDVADVA